MAGMRGNLGRYLSFLSTMARFHKYDVVDLASFAIEAPAMFTAVADKELWEKHFHRKINGNARGISLIRDGQKKIYYDVSETTAVDRNSLGVRLWKYNEAEHKKFLDAVVLGENSTERQLRIIAEELARRVNADEEARKIIIYSTEAVIAEKWATLPKTRQDSWLNSHSKSRTFRRCWKTCRRPRDFFWTLCKVLDIHVNDGTDAEKIF